MNLYSYVRNNPVNYYDPSGYSCEFKTIVIKTEGIEEQLDFLEQNIHGFSREQGRALLEYAFNPERNLSVVFGGSRIRGNYSPTSDLDVGVGSLTTSQAGRIIKKANKVEGGLPLEDNINCNWE